MRPVKITMLLSYSKKELLVTFHKILNSILSLWERKVIYYIYKYSFLEINEMQKLTHAGHNILILQSKKRIFWQISSEKINLKL